MSGHSKTVHLTTPPEFHLPPLTDAGGDVFEGADDCTQTTTATFWDTDDLRVLRAGASCWHDGDAWQVTLPDADGDAPGPWATSDADQPPADAADLLRALTRGAALQAVATVRTISRRVPLNGVEGRAIGAVVDEDTEVLDGETENLRTRGLILDFDANVTRSQRDAVVARVRAAGAEPADPVPPVIRVLGERATLPADASVPETDGTIGVADSLRRALGEAVAALVNNDPKVRLGDEAEAVHQMRVATRKIRSHLKTFMPLVDERWANEVREEVRWLGALLGDVRDAEVLLDRLESKIERLPEADRDPAGRLVADLRAQHADARDQLLEGLRDERYDGLLERLVSAVRRPRLLLRVDGRDDSDVLRGLVRGPVRKLRDAVDDLPDNPPDAALHEVRIDVKRARYAIEAVTPAIGKPARALARALVDVQDVLGAHQDAVIAADWLRDAAVKADDERVGFAAGQLAAIEHVEALEARDRWPDAWRAADKKKLRSWL